MQKRVCNRNSFKRTKEKVKDNDFMKFMEDNGVKFVNATPKSKQLLRKPSIKTLRNKADKLWSLKIRSKKYCEVCGQPANNPHHIVGRRNLTLRHDLRNGCLLCAGCHTFKRESAHQDPIWFVTWLMQNRSDDYNYLFEKREELSTHIDYEKVIKKL